MRGEALPMSETNSSYTIAEILSLGVIDWRTSAPDALSRMRAMKSFAVRKSTSASSNERLSSRIAVSISSGDNLPLLPSFENTAESFSFRASNMVYLPPPSPVVSCAVICSQPQVPLFCPQAGGYSPRNKARVQCLRVFP